MLQAEGVMQTYEGKASGEGPGTRIVPYSLLQSGWCDEICMYFGCT